MTDYVHGNTKDPNVKGRVLSEAKSIQLFENQLPVIDELIATRIRKWSKQGRKGKRPSISSIVRECVDAHMQTLEQELKPVAV